MKMLTKIEAEKLATITRRKQVLKDIAEGYDKDTELVFRKIKEFAELGEYRAYIDVALIKDIVIVCINLRAFGYLPEVYERLGGGQNLRIEFGDNWKCYDYIESTHKNLVLLKIKEYIRVNINNLKKSLFHKCILFRM